MRKLIVGLYQDRSSTERVVERLNEKGYVKEISIVARNYDGDELQTEQVKQEGLNVGSGAVAGGIVGTLLATLLSITAITTPAGLLLIGGPLTLAWMASGAAAGALAGGLAGALAEWGVSEETARMFEHRIMAGETLVAVTADSERESEIMNIMRTETVQEQSVYELKE